MKTAIIYYSMLGNTAFVASRLAELLGSEAELIRLTPIKAYPDKGFKKFFWGGKSAVMAQTPKLNPYTFDAGRYERVIIGFPVWAGRVAPPIRTFVEENKAELKGKSVSAFACQSGSGAEKALKGLKELLGIEEYGAAAIFIDPKDKPNDENERKITDFRSMLKDGEEK